MADYSKRVPNRILADVDSHCFTTLSVSKIDYGDLMIVRTQRFSGWGIVVGLILFASPCALTQRRSQPPLNQNIPAAANTDEGGLSPDQEHELQKKFSLQRQQEIKKDTDKLLQLATELKQSVDKSNENTLSLDVIKKAEQIEKLAKTVKDKMKGP